MTIEAITMREEIDLAQQQALSTEWVIREQEAKLAATLDRMIQSCESVIQIGEKWGIDPGSLDAARGAVVRIRKARACLEGRP